MYLLRPAADTHLFSLRPLVLATLLSLAGASAFSSGVLPGGDPPPPLAPLVPPGSPSSGGTCPRTCFCNPISRIIYCSRKGLASIPEGVAPDTLQLNLNGNAFHSSTVVRTNFSRFGELEHLYMSECGLESLEVDTFLDLGNLKWLDLSNNRLKVIHEHTFRGLTLEHLFLNGNRNLQLLPGSFEGLAVSGLYLHDCSIKSIRPEVIETLNGTLNYLWLNGNELERLDKSLATMFTSFQHLRLGSNPLHCGCDAVWLKEFFDSHLDVFKGALQPSCSVPLRLKGKHFDKLLPSDFSCQSPVFNNIDIMFADGQGRLKCSATGDPLPTLFWIQPTGKTTKYEAPTDVAALKTEGLLVLQGARPPDQASTLMGMYICVANNEAGNVTLAVNLSWPHPGVNAPHHIGPPPSHPAHSPPHHGVHRHDGFLLRPVPFQPSQPPTDPSAVQEGPNPKGESPAGGVNNVVERINVDVTAAFSVKPDTQRLFSMVELVGAVAATHVLTLIVALILLAVYYRRRGRGRRLETLPGRRGAGLTAADKHNTVLAADIVYHNTTNRNYALQHKVSTMGYHAHG